MPAASETAAMGSSPTAGRAFADSGRPGVAPELPAPDQDRKVCATWTGDQRQQHCPNSLLGPDFDSMTLPKIHQRLKLVADWAIFPVLYVIRFPIALSPLLHGFG